VIFTSWPFSGSRHANLQCPEAVMTSSHKLMERQLGTGNARQPIELEDMQPWIACVVEHGGLRGMKFSSVNCRTPTDQPSPHWGGWRATQSEPGPGEHKPRFSRPYINGMPANFVCGRRSTKSASKNPWRALQSSRA